jgi:hypothetical protein
MDSMTERIDPQAETSDQRDDLECQLWKASERFMDRHGDQIACWLFRLFASRPDLCVAFFHILECAAKAPPEGLRLRSAAADGSYQ